MSPQRIQRSRAPGWRKPENAVYVGRGSIWGNPFIVGAPCGIFPKGMGFRGEAETLIPALSLDQCIEFYCSLIDGHLKPEMYPDGRAFRDLIRHRSVSELRGKDLMCWCPLDRACHADELLKRANRVSA